MGYLRTIVSLIFFAECLFAGEYVFSYRLSTKDGMVLGEKYHVSPSMVSSRITKHYKVKYCDVIHEAKNEVEFIGEYKDKILDCLFLWGVKLEDESKVVNLQNQSITILSIPATRIYIEYDVELSRIYLLNKKIK